jgi:hypothetical protein
MGEARNYLPFQPSNMKHATLSLCVLLDSLPVTYVLFAVLTTAAGR